MALDGAFLYAIKSELEFLIGSRVEKVHQPSREEIIISLRTRQGSYKLLISANASSARVHITNISVDNPNIPPMFCMLLRKLLGSGKLIDIRQDGLERILFFDFECVNELGDIVTITLACEIMGRCSNLIIIGENGKVIDSIKRVDEEMSRERMVLPGMTYTLPPRSNRLNFLTAERSEIEQALENAKPAELSKVLIRIFEGVSPVLVREWTFYAGMGEYIQSDKLTHDIKDRLVYAINQSKFALSDGKCEFTSLSDKDGMLKDFSFIHISQYGNLLDAKIHKSAFELLDYFYAERDCKARMKQRANDLFKLLVNLTERVSKRLSAQRDELSECAERDTYKLYGDLISANIYKINKGDKVLLCENFYDEKSPDIEIQLNERKTPSQNAQHYYSEYKKLATAEEMLTIQISKGDDELKYLESVFDSLSRASTNNDISQLRLELYEQGYIKCGNQKNKPPKALPPVEYTSSDGFTILVGRNNKQNDQLSLKLAEKSDMWLHTQAITGSHVIIISDGAVVPNKTIEEAAIIAAVNSSGRNSNLVPVDYCLAKYVKKPSGAKPGKVIFTNYQTAFVRPDNELAEKLRAKQ